MVNKLHSWLTGTNDVIPLGVRLHNEVAKEHGYYGTEEALRAGWIRFALDFDNRLYAHIWDAGNLDVIERLEEFLYKYWVPRRRAEAQLAVEMHRPVPAYVYLSIEQMENEGFKDVLAAQIRKAVLRKKR